MLYRSGKFLWIANPQNYPKYYFDGREIQDRRKASKDDVCLALEEIATQFADALPECNMMPHQEQAINDAFDLAVQAVPDALTESHKDFADSYYQRALMAAIANAVMMRAAAPDEMQILGANPDTLLDWEAAYQRATRETFDQLLERELSLKLDGKKLKSFIDDPTWKTHYTKLHELANYLWQVRSRLGLNVFTGLPDGFVKGKRETTSP